MCEDCRKKLGELLSDVPSDKRIITNKLNPDNLIDHIKDVTVKMVMLSDNNEYYILHVLYRQDKIWLYDVNPHTEMDGDYLYLEGRYIISHNKFAVDFAELEFDNFTFMTVFIDDAIWNGGCLMGDNGDEFVYVVFMAYDFPTFSTLQKAFDYLMNMGYLTPQMEAQNVWITAHSSDVNWVRIIVMRRIRVLS